MKILQFFINSLLVGMLVIISKNKCLYIANVIILYVKFQLDNFLEIQHNLIIFKK